MNLTRFQPRRAGFFLGLLLAATLMLNVACSPKVRDETKRKPESRDMRGEIVGLSVERKILFVHHEEIPDYMPEMTMEFTIGEADISSFKEGQLIAARMIDAGSGEFRLEGIRVIDQAKDSAVDTAAKKLREDTFIRGKHAYREIGEAIPTFVLYNQDGVVVSAGQFRGQRVVINFIFTRCPVATMCPAATARMIELQRRARDKGVEGVRLVSISLDPDYDTPAVLKAYGAARGADFSNFDFLTGPEMAIRSLLAQFGVLAQPSESIWKHTLATVLIDRDGRIIHRVDGSSWDPEDFLKRL